jgi:hypothetical protein
MMRYAIAIMVAWVLAAAPTRAQEADVPTVSYKGVHLFCHVLHANKMTPLASWADAVKEPSQTTIVIFGDPSFLASIDHGDRQLKEFLKKRGSLLIATDRRFSAPALSVQFTGNIVTTPDNLREHAAYRGEVDCPLLTYVHTSMELVRTKEDRRWELKVKKGRDVRDHPLFGLLDKGIATNFPSEVRADAPLEALLKYPAKPDDWFAPGRGLPYMVGSGKSAPPNGRALYIAGHGMFINAMMAQTDSDNFAFANNAVRWLCEGPKDPLQHSKVLFYVDCEIIRDFDMKFTPPKPTIPIPPVGVLNRLVRGWENERFFQNILADQLGPKLGRFTAIVLAIVTFIVLIYGVKKFMEGRHHLETTVPILLGPPPAAKTPSEEREQALLRQGDLWEPSRRLVHDWLHQEFAVPPNRWLAGIDARFQASGGFWARWRLQRQADSILHLARSTKCARLSRDQFLALIETLRELSTAVKDGSLALFVKGNDVSPTRQRGTALASASG